MKKLLLSVLVLFAAQGAMADVLTMTASPIQVAPGAKVKYLKVFSNGQVGVTYCDSYSGQCDPSMYLATLSPYAMNYIYRMTEQARFGAFEAVNPLCTAVPSETKIYAAGSGSVILEEGSYPCGAFRQNTSDAAGYLISILRQYE